MAPTQPDQGQAWWAALFRPSGLASDGWTLRPRTTRRCARLWAPQVCCPFQVPAGGLAPDSVFLLSLSLSLFHPRGGAVASQASGPGSLCPEGLLESAHKPRRVQGRSRASLLLVTELPSRQNLLGAGAWLPVPALAPRTASYTQNPGSCGPWRWGTRLVQMLPGNPWPCSSSRWRPGSSLRLRSCW